MYWIKAWDNENEGKTHVLTTESVFASYPFGNYSKDVLYLNAYLSKIIQFPNNLTETLSSKQKLSFSFPAFYRNLF